MDMIDVHMKVWEHEFYDESYQSKWTEIRNAKLKEIEKAFDSLSFLDGAKRLFGDSKETSFKAFTNYLREDFKNKTGSESPAELIFQAEAKEVEDTLAGLFRSLNRSESFLQISCLLCSPNYTPPDKISDILCHLIVLGIRIINLRPGPPFITDMCMDLSLTKLVGVVNKIYEGMIRHGERELARVKRIAAQKKEGVKHNKGPVEEAFYRLNFKKGDKLNHVAKSIHVELNKKVQSPPSILTIRRYLENDSKIMANFKKEERFWIYQT